MINFIKKLFKKEKKLKKETQPIVVKQEIDYDKLAMAIVKAQKMIEADENKRLEEQQQQELDNWQKVIGYKCYDDDKANLFVRIGHCIRNFFSVSFHLITFKKKDATSDRVTFGLLQMATSGIFDLCNILLVALTVLFVVFSFITMQEMQIVFSIQPLYWFYAFLSFFCSRFFKIASFEMENLEDKDYIITIFSATTCFFAMVFALIALFKG